MNFFSKYLNDIKFEKKPTIGSDSISATTPLAFEFWTSRLTDSKININESINGDFLLKCREKISRLYKINSNFNVGFSIGASQVYFQTIASLTTKGDTVIIECPTYEPLKAVLRFLDLNIIEINILDPDFVNQIKLLNAKHKPKVFIFTSPNMPTGKVLTKEAIEILNTLDCPIVVDECYLPIFSNQWSSFNSFENIVSISNSSKTTGLSSLRVGWYITGISNFKENFDKIGTLLHVDIPTIPLDIFANCVICEIPDLHNYIRDKFDQNKKLLIKNPKILKIQAYNSIESGGYYTTLLFNSFEFKNVLEKLNKQKISIQLTDVFGLDNGIRISLNSDTDLFAKAIKTIADVI